MGSQSAGWQEKFVEYFSEKGSLVGIELGRHSLKAVLASGGADGLILEDFLVERFPQAEEVTRVNAAKERLAQFLKEKGVTSGRAFLLLEDERVFFSRLNLPVIPLKEMKQAMSWEVKDLLPFPAEEAVSDFQVIKEETQPDGSKTLDLMYFAVQRKAVENTLLLLQGTDLTPESVNLLPGALSEIVEAADGFKEKLPFAIIDFGFSHTTICIFKEKKLIFCRRISLGSNDITNSLLGEVSTPNGLVSLSYEDAEKIKQEYGIIPEGKQVQISGTSIDSVRLSSMMRPALERIINEVRNSFSYLQEKYNEPALGKIYFIGQGAKLKNLLSFVSNQLGIEAQFLPLESAITLGTGISKEKQADLPYIASTVAGMIREGKGLQFLPPEFMVRQRMVMEKVAFRFTAVVVSIILFSAFIYFSFGAAFFSKGLLKNEKLNQEAVRKLSEVKREIEDIKGVVSSVKADCYFGYLVLKEISEVTPTSVSIEKIDYQEAGGKLRLSGMIYGNQASASPVLTSYIKTLENSSLFEAVILSSSAEANVEEGLVLNFVIEAKMEPVTGR